MKREEINSNGLQNELASNQKVKTIERNICWGSCVIAILLYLLSIFSFPFVSNLKSFTITIWFVERPLSCGFIGTRSASYKKTSLTVESKWNRKNAVAVGFSTQKYRLRIWSLTIGHSIQVCRFFTLTKRQAANESWHSSIFCFKNYHFQGLEMYHHVYKWLIALSLLISTKTY